MLRISYKTAFHLCLIVIFFVFGLLMFRITIIPYNIVVWIGTAMMVVIFFLASTKKVIKITKTKEAAYKLKRFGMEAELKFTKSTWAVSGYLRNGISFRIANLQNLDDAMMAGIKELMSDWEYQSGERDYHFYLPLNIGDSTYVTIEYN